MPIFNLLSVPLMKGMEISKSSWKVYRVLPDEKAIAVGCLRMINESSEDYLYASNQFVFVDLPEQAHSQLLTATAQ